MYIIKSFVGENVSALNLKLRIQDFRESLEKKI